MNWKIFVFSVKNAFRRKSILLIAIIGTGLGTALMATLVSLSNGMDAELTSTLNEVASDITITSSDGNSMIAMFGGGTPIPEEYAERIALVDNVVYVQPVVSGTVSPDVAGGGGGLGIIGTPIVGLDLQLDRELEGRTTQLIEGVPIQNPYEVLMGSATTRAPGSEDLQIGDTLEVPVAQEIIVEEGSDTGLMPDVGGFGMPGAGVNPQIQTDDDVEMVEFTIVGIYETGSDFNDAGFVADIDEVREITNISEDEVTLMYVRASDTEIVEQVAEDIEMLFEDEEVPVSATLSKDILGQLNETLDIFRTFILVISLVAAIAGGMSIFIIMLMSVIERLQEFGIFKATGWSNFNIVVTVIIESITVALLGSGVGLTIGYLVGEMIDKQLGAEIALFDLQLVVMILTFGVVMGVLGGVLPAIKAARVSPIETLQSL